MIRVLFVCHGNICRSPMAEFIFKDMVNNRGVSDQFYTPLQRRVQRKSGMESVTRYIHRRSVNWRNMGLHVKGKGQYSLKNQIIINMII